MRKIRLEKEAVHKGDLILINRKHALSQEPDSENLIPAGGAVPMRKRAAAQLDCLLRDITGIVCVSGFRSRKEQGALYRSSLAERGEVFTRKYVAEAGHSEHESGLAVDLAQEGAPSDAICPSFPYSGACQRFRKKAPWFGFVQRYERGKEAITGIACEPWHFRYVGFPHSLLMWKKGLALEEYLELVKQSGELIWKYAGKTVWIQYLEAGKNGPVFAELPRQRTCRISGDNRSGFILTSF